MEIDSEIRAALIAYTAAHIKWKRMPDDGALADRSKPELGTAKQEAKRLRGKVHGKLLDLGKLLLHTTEN